MTNMPKFEEAVSLSKLNPGLDIGIHLNIIRGAPILPLREVPTLIDRNGYFSSKLSNTLFKIWTKRINIMEIEREWRAQIERALNYGINPTHLDSEKHIHIFPPLFKICIKLATEYKFYRIRVIRERYQHMPLNQALKVSMINGLYFYQRKMLKENKIRFVDHFFGLGRKKRMNRNYLKDILNNLPSGTTEIMTHPAYLTSDLMKLDKNFGPYYINSRREAELESLLSNEIKDLINALNIQTINYSNI